MTVTANGTNDEVAALLADFACRVDLEVSASTRHAAKHVLMDSLAVAVGALQHPAAQAARRYAYQFPSTHGCLVWGTSFETNSEVAALANGVPLRCYDYNDFYMGQRNGGHPSDIVAGVIAAAEYVDAPGDRLLQTLTLGYEVVLDLFDTFSVTYNGWDYANLTAIGATCAIARLMNLSPEQASEALAITVVPHLASNEIESGDLNRRGDLTMWKRFNGSDAVRQSMYACLLASAGVEGAVQPFSGELGFLNRVGLRADHGDELHQRLQARRRLSRISETAFKRWPVGSRAQSAIQAALAAREQIENVNSIRRVRVLADEAAYDHLVRIRHDPWTPTSRETADHSLPYIVAAAVLDGRVHTDSFTHSRVLETGRQRFLKETVRVESSSELTLGASDGFPSRVEIETEDGRTVIGEPAPPPGHSRHPFSDAHCEEKLHENADSLLGATEASELARMVWQVESLPQVRQLCRQLQAATSARVDEADTTDALPDSRAYNDLSAATDED